MRKKITVVIFQVKTHCQSEMSNKASNNNTITAEDLLCFRHYVVYFHILSVTLLTLMQDCIYYSFYTDKKAEAWEMFIGGSEGI